MSGPDTRDLTAADLAPGLWAHICPSCDAGWHVGGVRRCPECGRYGHSLRAEDYRLTDAYRAKRGLRLVTGRDEAGPPWCR